MSSEPYRKSTNPFEEDDDETVLTNSRRPQSTFHEQIQSLHERRTEIEDKIIQSTEKSLSSLRDSEHIGIATAEELARRRDQLVKIDERLDEINQTLKFSQKHINGLKSVFSSLKNYMFRKKDANSPRSMNTTTKSQFDTNSDFKETVAFYERRKNHPTTSIHQRDSLNVPSQTQASGSKNINELLDANLHDMSTSVSRLKGLAVDLAYEVDGQNDLIDSIRNKTVTDDFTIQKQNKDLGQILKK